MGKATFPVYNVDKIGVDVDTDNLHAPVGGFRQAQNIVRSPDSEQAASIVTRKGMRDLNLLALGSGPVLGGIAVPSFVLGSGDPTLFIGFGD